MVRFPKLTRVYVAFFHDLVMAAASFVLALYLRVGDELYLYDGRFVIQGTVLFALVCAVTFWSMRVYAGVWRYASLDDLAAITKAVTVAILVFLPIMFLMTRLEALPRSVLVITWFVLMGLLGGPRFIYRIFKARRLDLTAQRDQSRRVPVLLAGAGDAAEAFIRAVNRSRDAAYRVVGLVDEKGTRVGRAIHGVHVLGTFDDIPQVVSQLTESGSGPQRMIITKDMLDSALVRKLFDTADTLGIELSRLPKPTDFRDVLADRFEAKPITVEDLLGRPQAVSDRESLKALITGKRVLVTGAGGTIGAELARQIAVFEPDRLSLLDSSEYLLYTIDLEISERHPALTRRAILSDVRDKPRIERAMAEESPEIVFHAAALKHVPMVEANPAEGALTNVLGTRIVADACRQSGAGTMVFISTDKAVNPSSVMGATKRLAETYCQALDIVEFARPDAGSKPSTRFTTVRFGNVLGSTGSVVPLFQRQLAAGGPLTVTHPDMKRYFMTVREAVELVLEASTLGASGAHAEGKIFVLDMGEPVRILDIARQMIRLTGLKPETNIKIAFTGMRPGEKLFEEILHDSEPPIPTERSGILLAAPRTAEFEALVHGIDKMAEFARAHRTDEVLAALRRLVPEYQPASEENSPMAAAQ